MEKIFRNLKENEIDVRVAQCFADKGVSLLLYKDARVDYNILDETVGAMNWKNEYTRDNKNCIVSIWDEQKGQWISKENTGTESYTEQEKGLASDSFKRACFNWGIGRELYTAPFIYVPKEQLKKFACVDGKWKCNDKFRVKLINTIEGKIEQLIVVREVNRQHSEDVFRYGV